MDRARYNARHARRASTPHWPIGLFFRPVGRLTRRSNHPYYPAAMADGERTLVSALASLPRGAERGFRFCGTDRQERYFPYEALEAEAYRRGAHLAAMGLAKGDRVALVLPEPHEFVLTFLGAVVAGVVPVPIFPRASFKGVEGYVDTVAHIVRSSGARVLISMERMNPILEKLAERDTGLEHVAMAPDAFEGATPSFDPPAVTPEDLCFLQFTSGSTSRPKGVMVSHSNLVANATAFLGPHGLDRCDSDVGVSWLPLYHDMGLIGFILGTLICDIPVVILPTETFARTPRLWLETLSKHRGTITYAPNFAYQLAAKRVRDGDLAELDLSCVRVAGCGAEPIRAQTLRDFAERLAPAGFDPCAFLPSYGMAESTLAITFHPVGTPMVTDVVDADAMKRRVAVPAGPQTGTQLEVVSCGRPFPGHDLQVRGEGGEVLGERQVGEIVVRGPSVCGGYYRNAEATEEAFGGGWLRTGDLGYVADGNVYICGRVKDLIIIRGANHYPQDIEWVASDVPGVRRGNVVAFSVMRDGTEQLVVAAEGNSGDAAELRATIARRINEELGLMPWHVAIVPVGTLPKTSSGKAQRRKTRDLFEEGSLPEHPAAA
jgi:fatty-acyl-CoA synthase